MNAEIGNIDFLQRELMPKKHIFGEVLLCWDCKTPLPEEQDRYAHLNLWPLCRECAEKRELLKLQIIRQISWRRPVDA